MSDDSVNINVTENSKNTENKELPSIDEETETSSNNTTQPGSPTTNNVDDTKSQQIDLLTVDIKDENTALNVMVGFLGVRSVVDVLQQTNQLKFTSVLISFTELTK